MKRRNFLTLLNLLAIVPLFSAISQARQLKPFEYIAASKRKRVDKRWMHMYKSFDYYDYDFIDDMGFGLLRVIDDFELDHLTGTPIHPHKDMEIMTILLEGSLFHQDSLGHSGVLHSGDYQLMSAGSGLKHAETNPSRFTKTRGLQIWISSDNKDGSPRYQQREKNEVDLKNKLALIASSHDKQAMHLAVDGELHRGAFSQDTRLTHKLHNPHNSLYCFMIKGELSVFDRTLKAGDGLGIATHSEVTLDVKKNSDFILIETPKKGAF
jgi:redox-sensitive bicupin YhaK (pirin superfamily)